jgi:hypothetical protein
MMNADAPSYPPIHGQLRREVTRRSRGRRFRTLSARPVKPQVKAVGIKLFSVIHTTGTPLGARTASTAAAWPLSLTSTSAPHRPTV